VNDLQLLKILLGAIFILSGSILFGLVHAAITIHSAGYTIENFFYNVYWTRNLVPYILGVLQLILGILLIVLGLRGEKAVEAEEAAGQEK
jgi:uncharacterized membrane protein YphA (DoxX/SURF4 family)